MNERDDIVLHALDAIQNIARSYTDRPNDALQTIDVMINSVRDALRGETTPDVLAAELKALTEQIASEQRCVIQRNFDPGDEAP